VPGCVRVATHDREAPVEVALFAFGRRWTDPAKVKHGVAKIPVPEVRVPTVFLVASAGPDRRVFARVVAYPKQKIAWDPARRLYHAGTPRWFQDWADAVGLPIAPAELQNTPKPADQKHLLLLGRATAGKTVTEAAALSHRLHMNALVLDADWFETIEPEIATLTSKHMGGGLSEIAKEQWGEALRFSRVHIPPTDVLNRRTWIAGTSFPLVEEVSLPRWSQRVVLSCVPWEEILARRETADLTFLRLLASAAEEFGQPRFRRMPDVLWPPAQVVEKTAKERPVLAAAMQAWKGVKFTDIPLRIRIVDLRGDTSPPRTFLKELDHAIRHFARPEVPVIVLGDDPILNETKRAKSTESGKFKPKDDILWIPADTLPPDAKTRIRLMSALTGYHVPLGPFAKEAKP